MNYMSNRKKNTKYIIYIYIYIFNIIINKYI